jgi:hypothetical protein
MTKDGFRVWMALDVSTACIGITVLIEDGSDYGKIVEMTHISPKVPSKMKGIEALFVKKQQFQEFIKKFSDYQIDRVVIEEPLLSSNNQNTVATLLRFNGMISDCIYNELNVVPTYISSYEAREYSFPELMSIRKYGKDEAIYERKKILSNIKKGNFVLFGSYPWTIDKKTVLHEKVGNLFPEIQWQYDKNGELKKENFDATDSYVACLGQINKERYGVLEFTPDNIQVEGDKVEYDVLYWNQRHHRTTYLT